MQVVIFPAFASLSVLFSVEMSVTKFTRNVHPILKVNAYLVCCVVNRSLRLTGEEFIVEVYHTYFSISYPINSIFLPLEISSLSPELPEPIRRASACLLCLVTQSLLDIRFTMRLLDYLKCIVIII